MRTKLSHNEHFLSNAGAFGMFTKQESPTTITSLTFARSRRITYNHCQIVTNSDLECLKRGHSPKRYRAEESGGMQPPPTR